MQTTVINNGARIEISSGGCQVALTKREAREAIYKLAYFALHGTDEPSDADLMIDRAVPRANYDDDEPDGYLVSDLEYNRDNQQLVTTLLDALNEDIA